MKVLFSIIALVLCCGGCSSEPADVNFVYFNLGTNQIVVNSIEGLPAWVTPGVLVPVLAEDQLSEKSATSVDPIEASANLKIVWNEGGTSHQAGFKRDDVGIPAKIKEGEVRFSYLGGDKWRVTFIHP